MFDDGVVLLWAIPVGLFGLSLLVGLVFSSLGLAIGVGAVLAVLAWALVD